MGPIWKAPEATAVLKSVKNKKKRAFNMANIASNFQTPMITQEFETPQTLHSYFISRRKAS